MLYRIYDFKREACEKNLRDQREKMSNPNRQIIDKIMTRSQLTELMTDYQEIKERPWIRIHSDNFKECIDILASETEYTKSSLHRPCNSMRCCLIFWFGVVPDPLAHSIDDEYRKLIHPQSCVSQGRKRLYNVDVQKQKIKSQELRDKLEADLRRSYSDPSFKFNPSLSDFAEAYASLAS